ncbi:MAG: hypothetical protein A3C70_00800 [Candidatus Zambryskibacteria bacterium RIFCSPHIGHO2_02_FULL_43_14]|uniref:DUF2914 domain-containing protein n=1 Tax=Candidatus Zambryskibacteria bacterium RIFCSPHIGHO2_02_FULL_43_14 TaxID=1802748 RepID=A0A1G2TE50_9BACT|nr:MAG: hypothetical protein A2829_02845 [Candidatus Zambryskibacteria bacterium RIFCSPHIGHO2_01_FULL_43_60]OHA95550.1 MAG: hypothetical protein A3C70_00800 [Candidatus Zambryskibacteria bacterium RIFCSPHIGHO2_02_FULL_43_14]OHB02904.1 MAG: hypothetical protein A3B03_03240 [Candidatus Zambryskibacteria bacterium RIFCSPLOWO2_01_FULL_42_41]
MQSLLKKTETLYERYEKHISSFALVVGFIFDNLTIRRIDLLFENLTIVSYLVISGGSIIALNYYQEHPPRRSFFVRVQNFLSLFIQFAFGGLFSAFFVFYTRSATLSSSWPFVSILLFLLIGNEFFREHYQKIAFQVSIYFVAIFSFSIFFVPVLLKTMGVVVFMLSGVVSLSFIFLFSKLLFKIVPNRYRESRINLRNAILFIFILINVLYFSNLIPPIPLSLKDAGVYYSVERVGEDYRAVGERKTWYERIPLVLEVIHLKKGASLYVFSSVFAPTDLDTNIVHDWQYFDQAMGKWVSVTRITFSIEGGRGEGYRGFSKKEGLFAEKWRVDVKTERDQIIGRVRFDVRTQSSELRFEEKIL